MPVDDAVDAMNWALCNYIWMTSTCIDRCTSSRRCRRRSVIRRTAWTCYFPCPLCRSTCSLERNFPPPVIVSFRLNKINHKGPWESDATIRIMFTGSARCGVWQSSEQEDGDTRSAVGSYANSQLKLHGKPRTSMWYSILRLDIDSRLQL
jgi:hypothetical protein